MNADFEVKKLKDLVKKLELQNQHLRYKTGKLGPGSHSRPIQHDLLPAHGPEDDGSHSQNVMNDPRFQEVQKSDRCCWLFSMDKQGYYEDPDALISWLRYELDHPATQRLEYARREIISTLAMERNNAAAADSDTIAMSENRATVSKTRTIEKPVDEDDAVDMEDYASVSPPPVPREDDRFASHGPVHHMPLPSHTMTSKYGLIDVSSMESPVSQHKMKPRRSASPSSTQRTRGLSPSRSSQEPGMHSRSHRSPVRRGHSPSRMSETSVGSDYISYADRSRMQPRGQSPSRMSEMSVASDYINDKSWKPRGHSPSRISDTPLNSDHINYPDRSRTKPRGHSPSRMRDISGSSDYLDFTGRSRSMKPRGQSPSRMSDMSVNSDHINYSDRSRTKPRGLSPSRMNDMSASSEYINYAGRSYTRHRGQSPSRMSEISVGSDHITDRSRTKPRGQSPSRITGMSSSSEQINFAGRSHRKQRNPSPSKMNELSGSSDHTADRSRVKSSGNSTPKRYRSPSPAGRTPTPSKTTMYSNRDSPRLSNTESLYTPRSSGLRQPLSSSRLKTPRSARSAGISHIQSDMQRAVSSEELARTSEDVTSNRLPRSGYSSRKALPRPSRSTGLSSPKYLSPRNRPVKEYASRSSPDHTQTSPGTVMDSNAATSVNDDVWNDGEFF